MENTKKRVYMYGADGNSIIAPYKDIEAIGGGFYRYLIPYRYGDEFGIVRDLGNGLFVEIYNISTDRYDTEIEEIKSHYSNFLTLWETGTFPNLLMIKMNELIGNDITSILEKREEILEERRKIEVERSAKIKQKEFKDELDLFCKAKEYQSKLVGGSEISWKDLAVILSFCRLNIHGRTLGILRKHIDVFGSGSIVSTTRAHIVKNTQVKTRDSIFAAIKAISVSVLVEPVFEQN